MPAASAKAPLPRQHHRAAERNGNAPFTITLGSTQEFAAVTATAMRDKSTSEFSNCVAVGSPDA